MTSSIDRAKELLELVNEQEGLQEGGSELDQLFDIQTALLRGYIGAIEVLKAWGDDVYQCRADTCKCNSKWHMKEGPTTPRIVRTDGAIANFNGLFPEEVG